MSERTFPQANQLEKNCSPVILSVVCAHAAEMPSCLLQESIRKFCQWGKQTLNGIDLEI